MTHLPSSLKLAPLMEICRVRGWQIGLAESCTGGLLSSWIAQVPGVSSFYQGSIVSYSAEVKNAVLGVPWPMIKAHGEVSLPVAQAMARGAIKALSCDWAVAITGIAGPTGGTPEKPVGLVCFAVVGPGFEKALAHHFAPTMERHKIQQQSAVFAFDLLISALR